MNHPKVTVITLNWNRKEDTIECVKSLLALDYPNYEVVVVDNGSTDGSVETFKQHFPSITVIENKTNLGYGQGFNKGIEYALAKGAKYMLVINNDAIIDNKSLAELVRVAESDPKIGLVSGKTYYYNAPNRLQTVGKIANFTTGAVRNVGLDEIDNGQHDELKEYHFLDDVYWLARGELFKKIGLYDKNFFIYYEEVDLCARASKAGYKIIYTPHAKIWHKQFTSTGGRVNPFLTYHITRNRIIFMKRNATQSQFIRFALYYIFIRGPLEIAGHLRRGQSNLIVPFARGMIAGMMWTLTS
jgi:GT2 family glycosyltransferase